MNDRIREYWKALRKLEASLPEFVWLMAVEQGAPSFVTQVAAPVAAKLLHAKSHRVATDEEIAAQRGNDAAAVKQAVTERKRKSGAAVVVVDEPPTPEPAPKRRR